MKLLDNLHTQVAFVTGPEEHSEPLGGFPGQSYKALNSATFKLFSGCTLFKSWISLFGHFPFLAPAHFPEAFWPRYGPDHVWYGKPKSQSGIACKSVADKEACKACYFVVF